MAPFSLVLHLTHRCNLRCAYCYAGRSLPSAMSAETAEDALGLGLSLAEPGQGLDVGFFGGEPLLEFGRLRECVALAERLAAEAGQPLQFQLTTNGTLLTGAIADYLAEHRFELTVSVDGLAALHDEARPWPDGRGSFEGALEGLEAALSRLPETVAAWVVTPGGARRLAEGVGFLAGRGVRNFQMAPEAYSDWDASARAGLRAGLRELARLYTENWDEWSVLPLDTAIARCLPGELELGCGYGARKLSVSASGRLYPCERLVGEDGEAERARCIGSLRDGLARVWPMPGGGTGCPCGPMLRSAATAGPDPVQDDFEQACAEAALELLQQVYQRRGLTAPQPEPARAALAGSRPEGG